MASWHPFRAGLSRVFEWFLTLEVTFWIIKNYNYSELYIYIIYNIPLLQIKEIEIKNYVAYIRDCAYIGDCACIFSTKDKITCAFIRVGATNRANTVNIDHLWMLLKNLLIYKIN